jgi:FG-GAP-like repeat/ASPIC and UnbV
MHKNRKSAWLASSLLAATLMAGLARAATQPAFTAIQRETFSVPGSLSNAWADFDNDGDLDLAVSLKGGEVRLYRNDKGVLTNIGAAVGLPTTGKEVRGLSWGDYDGDGYLDLLGGSNVMPIDQNRSFIWKNQGGKHFVEVAEKIGLTIPNRISRQANWVDYDNDGQVDLYASNRAGPNQLFHNEGGLFRQVFADNGVTDSRPTVGSCWFDYNRDGKLDLFLANQSGATDALWRNDGEKGFTDVAPSLGLDAPGRAKEEGGVGCAIGDYDNDGHLDIFVAVYGADLLYRNKGDGTFEEVGKAAGVADTGHAVGAAWGDYDNDGYLDLYVTSYEGEAGKQTPLDLLYHNNGKGGFDQVLTRESLLNAGDHGVEWIDYDGDGALDLSVMRGYSPVGGHFLFHNDLQGPARGRSLSVLVLDAKGHYTRAGAEVRLYDKAGKILASRLVSTGGGYNAQSAAPVHFGLKSFELVTVEVSFMSSGGVKKKTVRGVDPRAFSKKPLILREDGGSGRK